MKIKQYLKSLPVGEVVTKNPVLALFKRMGFIYDYEFGYLLSRRFVDHMFGHYLFPQRNAHLECKNNEWDKWCEEGLLNDDRGFLSETFKYEGMTFGKQYFDGCFMPYLIKLADNN